MASLEGNRLPAPGIYSGTATDPVEILYSEVGLFVKGGTLKPGQGVVAAGEGVKYDATSKQYIKATTAAEVEGFNRYAVDTGAGADSPVFHTVIVLGGKLQAAKLSVTGATPRVLLDATAAAAAATALGGRYIASRDVLEF